LLKID